MNKNLQPIWETLLAVRSLDELESGLRQETQAALLRSPELAAAWDQLQAFDGQIEEQLFSADGDFISERCEQLRGPLLDTLQAARAADREYEEQLVAELQAVEVPIDLESRVLARLAAESHSSVEPAVELPSALSRPSRRGWLVAATAVAASLLGLVYYNGRYSSPATASVESLAAEAVQSLATAEELAWRSNTKRLPWSMPEMAPLELDGQAATAFRGKQAGEVVFLVRVEHEVAATIQQRLPFREIPTSGGWHVGAWSDGVHLYLACSRHRESLELFRADLQAI